MKKNKYMKTQNIEVQIFKDGGSEVGVFFSQGDTTMDDKCT